MTLDVTVIFRDDQAWNRRLRAALDLNMSFVVPDAGREAAEAVRNELRNLGVPDDRYDIAFAHDRNSVEVLAGQNRLSDLQ
jgi:hypothetical protein